MSLLPIISSPRPVLTTVCMPADRDRGLIADPPAADREPARHRPPTAERSELAVTTAPTRAVEEGVHQCAGAAVNGVENMDFITSSSAVRWPSSANPPCRSRSGTDGDINQVNVQNRVALAPAQLPAGGAPTGVVVNKAS